MAKFMCQFWSFVGTSFGIVILDECGKVQYASANVNEYLKRAFDHSPSGTLQDLPPQLLNWLATTATAKPFCQCHAGRRLVVTSQLDGNAARILLFTEQRHIFCAEELKKVGLTTRESEVLRWMAEGKSYEVIGTILKMSKRTAENHVQSIFKKFDVSTRREAVLHALDALGHQDFAATSGDTLAHWSNSCLNCPGSGLKTTRAARSPERNLPAE